MTNRVRQEDSVVLSPVADALTGIEPPLWGGSTREDKATGEALVRQFLTIKLGDEQYAVPIGSIVEILKYRPVTSVPRSEVLVHGIISLRGRVITVLDGRVRLGLSAAKITVLSRIVVMLHDSEPVGILVDAVHEVVKLSEESIRPAPGTVEKAAEHGIQGVCDSRSDSLLIILDMEHFLRL